MAETTWLEDVTIKPQYDQLKENIEVDVAIVGAGIAGSTAAYSFSKSGVINLMQTLGEEHKEDNITFNAIIPSVIDSPANRESMQNHDFSAWVTPLEIAETCLFLLGDGAKSYRGNVIKMYGKV